MTRLTEPEVKAALDRIPREYHRLLLWLITGQQVTGTTKNGTA